MAKLYVIIANEEVKVKECVVLSDYDKAQKVFEHLCDIWGNENVAFVARKMDDVSFLVGYYG